MDAGVQVAGNTSNLDVSVAGLVADGRGGIETSSLMVAGARFFTAMQAIDHCVPSTATILAEKALLPD